MPAQDVAGEVERATDQHIVRHSGGRRDSAYRSLDGGGTARPGAKPAGERHREVDVELTTLPGPVAVRAAVPAQVEREHGPALPSQARAKLPPGVDVLADVVDETDPDVTSPDELAAFEAAGAVAVRLGDEVLRTSTAGLAAASALLARTPRWGPPST